MKTNNKMKDSEAESKEWWEVADEYFAKELEKNLAQHKVDEIFLRYKLGVCQMHFSNFVYGSPTSIEASDKDEEAKQGPTELLRRRKCR
jgi:hypothetical protein